ncbi:hypothetical protein [Pseudomonas chlororaphis]|uniref:hypothetical protein n=1 Tax=Pseudomonas chlororaphis TaxID=587753 RepID=UPI001926C48A|nr:hypothetical protein [Pseudomonas chlororaphis]QQX60949.1 hypothetical protein JHW28_10515 [Pseudomonas chlororaphis subsp. aurantiaca]UVE47741.1 hypothetical protein KS461_10850 [Pseudomonas chlororaphis]
MNYEDQKVGINAEQASNYKLKLSIAASIFTALSGCTTTSQHDIKQNYFNGHYYNKLKSENPDYHWEFIERSHIQ